MCFAYVMFHIYKYVDILFFLSLFVSFTIVIILEVTQF